MRRVLFGWFKPDNTLEVLSGYLKRTEEIERKIERIAGEVAAYESQTREMRDARERSA